MSTPEVTWISAAAWLERERAREQDAEWVARWRERQEGA